VTDLLRAWGAGEADALDRLVPLVYDELRHQARRYLRREAVGHTLQTTGLVHEAYLRLVDQRAVRWESRAQFFGVAAQLMRRILVDHARAQHAAKRGGSAIQVPLEDDTAAASERDVDLLALDEALTRLAALSERQARVVELRYFAGLGIEETAEVLGVSIGPVKRDWAVARAWLRRELAGG
jgi:RNA polymerase sigma factor (TIGR02999 family)